MEKPRLSAAQQRRLRNIGLIEAQIEQLEMHALPLAKAWTRPLPDATTVRRELDELRRLVLNLQAKLQELEAAESASGQREALLRIEQAAFDACTPDATRTQAGDDPVNAWSCQLGTMLSAIHRADEDMPKGRRSTAMTADPRLIGFIESDLLDGWLKKQNPEQALPPYPSIFRVSSSAGSVFREVVETCYEAVGITTSAERAVKAFIRWKGQATQATRESK